MDEERYRELLRRKAQQIGAKSAGMESMPRAKAARGVEPRLEAVNESAQLEAVIRWYRPVLAVTDDHFVRSDANPEGDPRFFDPNDGASRALLDALEAARPRLDAAIRSVGRIELMHNAVFPWVGTGWIVDNELDSDILVTNAHVAREFGMRSGTGFRFRPGTPDFAVQQSAAIDFREELGRAPPREFPVTEIIWISETPGLDMAILRVARTAGSDRIDPPIKLAANELSGERMIAVIGFPGSNSGYDPEPFRRLFGPVLGKKRFSPGFYTGLQSGSVTHDCSTLPGSSGSVVLDVETGQAAGLHFAGNAFETNYAVPAPGLARIFRERPWQGETARARPSGRDTVSSSPARAQTGGTAGDVGAVTLGADGALKLVVPLEITIKLGLSRSTAAAGSAAVMTLGTNRERPEAVAASLGARLGPVQGVLSVTADYLFRDGVITDELGVVVGVAPGASLDPRDYDLPPEIDGVAIVIEHAAPATIVENQLGSLEAFSQRRAGYERDLKEPRFDLSPVTDDMRITLHASPEAGWPVLKGFLATTGYDQLSIGMYHMTAPHVVEAIADVARRSRLTLTLDRQRGEAARPDDTIGDTKENDIPERKTLARLSRLGGDRFNWAPASLGANGLFASAYHIKAAVWSKLRRGGKLDDRLFWLSSGNWHRPIKRRSISRSRRSQISPGRKSRTIIANGMPWSSIPGLLRPCAIISSRITQTMPRRPRARRRCRALLTYWCPKCCLSGRSVLAVSRSFSRK